MTPSHKVKSQGVTNSTVQASSRPLDRDSKHYHFLLGQIVKRFHGFTRSTSPPHMDQVTFLRQQRVSRAIDADARVSCPFARGSQQIHWKVPHQRCARPCRHLQSRAANVLPLTPAAGLPATANGGPVVVKVLVSASPPPPVLPFPSLHLASTHHANAAT